MIIFTNLKITNNQQVFFNRKYDFLSLIINYCFSFIFNLTKIITKEYQIYSNHTTI